MDRLLHNLSLLIGMISQFYYMRYSFDIFDTCLLRVCGEPKYVFDLLAYEVLGDNAQLTAIADFSWIRREAELTALNKVKGEKEDVTLAEIYSECDFSRLTSMSKDKIMDIELRIEDANLKPIYKTLEIIENTHKKGGAVDFISDMYLPYDFILNILKRHGFYKEGDQLYLSSKIGLTKRNNGNLFNYVRKKNNLITWIHRGDNLHSDIITPFKKGIFSISCKFNYTYYEKKIIEKDLSLNESPLTVSASISRAILNEVGSSNEALVAADLMAPLYVSFTYNILKDAEKRGINKVYFAARDCYPLYEIAKILASSVNSIEVSYLYISRKSTYLAGLGDISEATITEIVDSLGDKSLASVLDIMKIKSDRAQYYSSIFPELNGTALVRELFKHPSFLDELTKSKKEDESNLLSYLLQEGIGSGECAIVDLRGSRRCIKSINYLLKKHHYNQVFSYHFEVLTSRICDADEGYISTLYSERYNSNNKYLPLASNILEEYFSASQQHRTLGYSTDNGKTIPLFDEDLEENEFFQSQKIKIEKVNIQCCQLYAKWFIETKLHMSYASVLQASVSLLSDFMRKPHSDYLKAFYGYRISDSKVKSRPLISPMLYKRNQTGWTRGSFYSLLYTIMNPFYLVK